VIFFLLCGTLVTGCSNPANKKVFTESDFLPRMTTGQQITPDVPAAGQGLGEPVLLPPGANHAPGAPMPDVLPSEALSDSPVVRQGSAAPVEEKKEPGGRKNPFLRESEESVFDSAKDRLPVTYLNLSAIFYSPGASAAIIDGRFFKEGDTVDNKKIVTISAEEVILKDAQSVYVLKLKGILD
jgi:hypothetical protein